MDAQEGPSWQKRWGRAQVLLSTLPTSSLRDCPAPGSGVSTSRQASQKQLETHADDLAVRPFRQQHDLWGTAREGGSTVQTAERREHCADGRED